MKPIILAGLLALAATGASAQDVRHDTIAILCNFEGECGELVHPNPSESLAECEALGPVRFVTLMQYISTQPGLAAQTNTVNVICRPVGQGT